MSTPPQQSTYDNDPRIRLRVDTITEAITDLQNKRDITTHSFTLWTFTKQLCFNHLGPDLYVHTGDLIVTHLGEKVCHEVMELPQTETFLTGLLDQYYDHLIVSEWLSHLFWHVDRRIKLQNDASSHLYVMPVLELCFSLFRQVVLADNRIQEKLTSIMLATLDADRAGNAVDTLTFKEVCHMLITCGVGSRGFYEEVFETPFLNKTANFFRDQIESFIKDNSASDYIRKVNESLNDEERRALRFLDDATRAKLRNVLHEQLIAPHVQPAVNIQ